MVKDRLAELQKGISENTSNAVDTTDVTVECEKPKKKKNVFKKGYKALKKKGSGSEDEKQEEPMVKLQQMADVISQQVDKLDELVAQTNKAQSQHLTSKRSDEELEKLADQFKLESRKAKGKLTEFDGILKSVQLSDAESRMITNTYSHLVRRTVTTNQEFNKITSTFYDKYRKQLKHQLSIAGYSENEINIDEMLENGEKPQIFNQNVLASTAEARLALRDAEDRYDQLMAVEKSIVELNDMYKDLALMVDSQGSVIDRIAYNVEEATVKVETGQKQLKEAEKKKKGFRKKKIICISVIVVVVLILLLIVIFEFI